jgi:putative hydrolase of the HAD superfamily
VAEILAVTLDVGGTLIRPSPGVGEIYARIAGEYGVEGISPDILDQRFLSVWQNLKNFNYTREDWSTLVAQVFAGLTPIPSQIFFGALYSYFAEAEAWHVFGDVFPALDKLAAAGVRLGIISNWDERLRPLLNQLQLDRYFEAIVISSEIGFHKPSPVIFEYAAQKLGLRPAALLHVGDSAELDAEAARRAGFHAVELCRAKPLAANDAKIGSLMEIDFTVF